MAKPSFDGRQTDSMGMWWNEDWHAWQTSAFRISDRQGFKGSVRILVRRNRFYKKDTNRPYFTVQIVSSRCESDKDLGSMSMCEDCEYYGKSYTGSEVYDACSMVANGYSLDDIAAEY